MNKSIFSHTSTVFSPFPTSLQPKPAPKRMGVKEIYWKELVRHSCLHLMTLEEPRKRSSFRMIWEKNPRAS